MKIERVPVSSVDVGERMRPVNQSRVDSLATSMATIGLLQPITVFTPDDCEVRLVAGLHRLEAARRLDWDEIDAIFMDADDVHRELAEIDENLCRAELSPAEAAYQTSRRKDIYETLHPEARHGAAGAAARWNADDKLAPAFADATEKATGRDKRTVQRDAARGEVLGEALKDIAGTSLDKGVELDALAKLPADQRGDIVARAKSGESISARAMQGIKAPKIAADPLNDAEAAEKQVAALMTAWNNAGADARAEFLERIGQEAPIMDRRFG
jgi:hypothetical protein